MTEVILSFIIMFLLLEDLLLASVMMLCIFISINILLLLFYYYYYCYYNMLLYDNILHLFIFSSSWIASAMWSHGSSGGSEGILLYSISFQSFTGSSLATRHKKVCFYFSFFIIYLDTANSTLFAP